MMSTGCLVGERWRARQTTRYIEVNLGVDQGEISKRELDRAQQEAKVGLGEPLHAAPHGRDHRNKFMSRDMHRDQSALPVVDDEASR